VTREPSSGRGLSGERTLAQPNVVFRARKDPPKRASRNLTSPEEGSSGPDAKTEVSEVRAKEGSW
jgi:hypothetical protein